MAVQDNKDGPPSMKRLVAATGLHRQTIHFYLREGLLPPPSAGAGTRNARYSEQHLALLELIRELREDRGMSLEAIRRHFTQCAFDPAEVRRTLAGGGPPALTAQTEPEQLAPAELVLRTGAPERLLRSLVDAGVLTPDAGAAGESYGPEALSILSAARRLEEQGMASDALLRLSRHAEAMASAEVAALAADASGLTGDGEPLALRAERRHADISELVTGVRRSALRGVLRRLVEVGPRARRFAEEAIYIPSPLFIRRYQLDRALAEAEAAAERGDPAASRRLGRLLLGLGRYEEAARSFARSAQQEPGFAETHAWLGLARSTAGEIAAGVEACRRALALAPESPRAHAFLGGTLAIHAAMTMGLDNPGLELRHALDVALKSREYEAADRREHMETLLARGRMFTVLPSGVPGHAEGVADLEEVLVMTAGTGEDSGLDFPGTNALNRVHALYYLGVAAPEERRFEEARAWLSECITIDPMSRFAELAYELLGNLER